MTSPPSSNDAWNTWCPSDSIWAAWAKPLLFAVDSDGPVSPFDWLATFQDGDLPPFLARDADSFVVVDVPGPLGVTFALLLAGRGFRPVPLYNGVPGVGALVDVRAIQHALYSSTPSLASYELRSSASPAFLLDSNRMDGAPLPRTFDNRWVTTPEDFPSANRLLASGLRRCIVVRARAADDLAHVLVRYAEAGIELVVVEEKSLVPLRVARPQTLTSFFRRLAVQWGLRRSSAGGFGGFIPEPQSSGG